MPAFGFGDVPARVMPPVGSVSGRACLEETADVVSPAWGLECLPAPRKDFRPGKHA